MKRWKLSQAAEWVVLRNALAMYGVFTGVAGVLCYRSVWTVVCCLPMLVFFYRQEQNRVQQKRMVRLRQELKVMLIVPFGLLLYLRLTSPGYLDVFYHNLFGIVFMSGSLVVIAVAYIWSQRILTRLEK